VQLQAQLHHNRNKSSGKLPEKIEKHQQTYLWNVTKISTPDHTRSPTAQVQTSFKR